MKRLFVIGLCLAVALAAPRPDDDDDLDDDRLQQFGRRRFQHLRQLDDDDDGQEQNSRRSLLNPLQQLDDEDSLQKQQIRRRLQELTLKLVDDHDDSHKHDMTRHDDRDDDKLKKSDDGSNLDLLAKELDNLVSKYKGRGVLKVDYSPPLGRNVPDSTAHNLGSINFKYYTPSDISSQSHSHRDIPVPNIKPNNGYVLLRALDRPDLRDDDDDDDDL